MGGIAKSGSLLGVGQQRWASQLGTKSNGTSYQNTTGSPIMVCVQSAISGSVTIEVSTDNATWVVAAGDSSGGAGGVSAGCGAIVPSNHFYRVNGAGTYWAELR